MEELNEKIKGLVKKAEKSGMPYSILKKVYDRGMAAWKTGHRPGTTPQQWAFARVNSFVTKSSGTWGKADKDLADKVRGAKKESIQNPRKAKDIIGQVREKLGKDADAGDYIKDFRKSDAPQFKGKSDKKIRDMAIAAYLDSKDKKESVEEQEMKCPPATQDIKLNVKNRDATIKDHNYGPLNVDEPGDYWEKIADYWNTTEEAAKKSTCGVCVAFDISPRMDKCMPGETSDDDGRLGYCWMHHFKCHSARSCHTWAKGGPITKDEKSYNWQERAGMNEEKDLDEAMAPHEVKISKTFKTKNPIEIKGIDRLIDMSSIGVVQSMQKQNPKGFKKTIMNLGKIKEDAPTVSTGPAIAGTGDDSSTVIVRKKKKKQIITGDKPMTRIDARTKAYKLHAKKLLAQREKRQKLKAGHCENFTKGLKEKFNDFSREKFIVEDNVAILRKIVKDKRNMPVKLKDGQMKVDLYTASAFVQTLDNKKIRPDTKKKLEFIINKGNKSQFLRTVNVIFK